VKDEMERRLTLMPDLGMDDDKPDGGSKEMKIAVVTCAFDNSKIINWLRERGDAIKNEHWDKLDKINDHIRRNLKKDSQLLDKLQRPCSLFITFESEEAYNRALLYNQCIEDPSMPEYARFRTFLGEEIEIQPASEPTDIIWENRSFTERERNIKKGIVSLIIIGLLMASFAIIFVAKKASLAKKNQYPKVNCKEFEENYGLKTAQW
jgi:hypothetical protein